MDDEVTAELSADFPRTGERILLGASSDKASARRLIVVDEISYETTRFEYPD